MGSNQSLSDIADFYGIFTFQDPLIYWTAENHESWVDREFSLRKDFYIKTYVKRLDEEIFSERPVFTPDIFGNSRTLNIPVEQSEGPDNSEASRSGSSETSISEDWDNERWNNLFVKIFDKSRVHSYSVVTLYDEPPYWRVYCEREITEIYYNEDDVPIGCHVEWTKSLPKSDKYIFFEEDLTFVTRADILLLDDTPRKYALFIPFGVPDSEDQLGEFDLEDKWTLAINMRYCNLDITNNSAKSSGFYWMMYGSGISPTGRQDLLNALDLAGQSRGIGAKENVLKDLKAMFPAKPEFTLDALESMVRQYAMACRLPLAYFRSESEGGQMFSSGTFSTGEEIKINKKKLAIFGKFREYIKDLVFMRWGVIVDNVEPFLYETEEEEIEIPINEESTKKDKEVNGSKIELIK